MFRDIIGFASDDPAYSIAQFRADISQSTAVVETFDAAAVPYLTSIMNAGDFFFPGRGYWVWVPTDVVWDKPF
ncbi:MAG: hypothetical protein V1934_08735 [Methanobacteriota archaeon]